MRRSDIKWIYLAAAVHLLLLLGVYWQNGDLQAVWGRHDAVYYTAHLADPLLQGDLSWWANLTYRAMRVGYILLALPLRWLGVVPALIVVNICAVAVGTIAIRRIAELHGASTRLAGLLWILNPGALIATALLLPDTIAWAAILLCLLAAYYRRWVAASLLAILAALTKEASLLAVGFAGLTQAWQSRSWHPLIPSCSAGVFHLSLLAVLTRLLGPTTHSDFITPFVGWLEAFDFWIPDRTRSMVTGLFALASGLLVLWVWWRRRDMFLAAAAGQAVLMLFLAGVVVAPMSNSLRIGGLFWPLLAATYVGDLRLTIRAPLRLRS